MKWAVVEVQFPIFLFYLCRVGVGVVMGRDVGVLAGVGW